MAASLLHQLPFVSKATLPPNATCPLCHEEFCPEDRPVRLPCPSQHVVGQLCITAWLSLARHEERCCPCCRYMFSNANGGDEGADNNDMNLAERPDEEESYSSRHTRMSAQELAQSTRHEREVALYQHFRTLGAPMVPLNDAKGPQSQSDVLPLGRTSLANCSLFLHLERIGAFEECELPSDLRRVESDRELRSRLAREGLDVPDSVSAPDNMRQALGAKKLWGLLRERGFVYWPGEGWRLN